MNWAQETEAVELLDSCSEIARTVAMRIAEHRKNLGIKVLLFVFVLTALLYAVKRQIWSRVH